VCLGPGQSVDARVAEREQELVKPKVLLEGDINSNMRNLAKFR